ncbi:TRAM domain-containing protein [Vulcanisaeta thermophila]|uniref:TRAM domain-containing protein n=1 Tax=Vulcanisaeta thermophila TaxID=867917 RepID=UPI000853D361
MKAVTTSGNERPRRRGPRGRGPRGPKPVNVGDVVDVEITEVSKRGDGIARIRGFVIFVPNTKPGDKVKVKITRIGRSYAVAEVTQGGEATSTGEAESEETEEDLEE